MRSFILMLMVLAASGCAQQPKVGNFSDLSATVIEADLVSDAIKQMTVVYPPAKTRFVVAQPTNDPFGSSLVARLREKGYAIDETKRKGGTPSNDGSLSLAYVVDNFDVGLYGVTLKLGEQSLSRAYWVTEGSVKPAGSWSRKE